MTKYKVYETACHPNKWKVALVVWSKGSFYPTLQEAVEEADRLNGLTQDSHDHQEEALNG